MTFLIISVLFRLACDPVAVVRKAVAGATASLLHKLCPLLM